MYFEQIIVLSKSLLERYDSINSKKGTQFKAVSDNGLNLKYVSHFEYWQQGDEFKINEEVETAAVKQNIKAIKYCNTGTMGKKILKYINSSEYLQLKAVKADEYFIMKIDKPSKKVQIAAVENAYDQEMFVYTFINEEDLCKELQKKYF